MNTNNTNSEDRKTLFYPELSYKITGLCFEVHNELGRYAREKQYADFIEDKLKETELSFKREQRIGESGNILDFVIQDRIVLEIKAKKLLLKEDYYQIQRYLQCTHLKLGLLINFRNRYLKPKRIIRIETDAKIKFL